MRTLAQDFPPRPLICPGFPFSRRITFFIKKLDRKRPPQDLRRAFSIIIFNKNQYLRREKLCPRINRRERSPHANLSEIVVLHPAIVVLPPAKNQKLQRRVAGGGFSPWGQRLFSALCGTPADISALAARRRVFLLPFAAPAGVLATIGKPHSFYAFCNTLPGAFSPLARYCRVYRR